MSVGHRVKIVGRERLSPTLRHYMAWRILWQCRANCAMCSYYICPSPNRVTGDFPSITDSSHEAASRQQLWLRTNHSPYNAVLRLSRMIKIQSINFICYYPSQWSKFGQRTAELNFLRCLYRIKWSLLSQTRPGV